MRSDSSLVLFGGQVADFEMKFGESFLRS